MTSDYMEAWNISDKNFPHEGSVNDKLAFAAKYATLGPSTYNTQPWVFEIKEETLFLWLDRRYGLPVIDQDDRQLFNACASALFSLRLALKYFGYEADVSLLPDQKNEVNLMAIVKLGGKTKPSEDESSLFKSITKRHMNRGAFQPGKVDEKLIESLKAAAAKEGGWLHACSDEEKDFIGDMILTADHMQYAKKRFRRELCNWLDPRRADCGDGMPQLGLNYKKVIEDMKPVVARRFTDTEDKIISDEYLKDEIPLLVILGSTSNSAKDRLYAGQAYGRVLLTAQMHGLGVTPLNQPLEVPELRLGMHDELDLHGRAQIILRIGYPKKKPTIFPRRPYGQVIITPENSGLGRSSTVSSKKKGVFAKISRLFLANGR